MRWITVGPAGQKDVSIVLHPPAVDPGITDDERRTITEMMAKGTYATIVLSSPDVDAAFAKVEASGADVVQEPSTSRTESATVPSAIRPGTRSGSTSSSRHVTSHVYNGRRRREAASAASRGRRSRKRGTP